MSRFYCVVAVIFTICHVVNAGSLTRQCHASNGTCAKKASTCETNFGSGWRNIGKCCRGVPCCKFQSVQCEDLQPQPNGMVSVNGRDIGNVANFSCKSRYTLLGSQSLRCTDSGWDGDIPICDDWWIGLQDNNTEGTFNWVSGQPLTYTDWYQGTPIQPDNKNKAGAGPANCAALVFSYQYQWGDENCDSIKQIICESGDFDDYGDDSDY